MTDKKYMSSNDEYRMVDRNSVEAKKAEKDDRLYFDVQWKEEGTQKCYFTKPIVKLGDGTFGAVFEVRVGPESYALKILYGFREGKNPSLQFNYESNANTRIKVVLREENRMEYYEGLIDIEGRTNDFLRSEAGKKIKQYLEEQNISMTDFGLLMPMYNYTLKDLLEKCIGEDKTLYAPNLSISHADGSGTPQEATPQHTMNHTAVPSVPAQDTVKDLNNPPWTKVQPQPQESRKPTGYEVLAKQDFDQRIGTIMPYLRRVAQGLCALHAARCSHLDVKPANIFVKENLDDVNVVLGDLGTTKPVALVGDSDQTLWPPQDRPLGTRHYRSPEQKDYFDSAYVSVESLSEGEARLIVNDPKFMDSIIEEDDYVEFSKTPTKTYRIKSIECKLVDERLVAKEITIKDCHVTNDPYTQVFFHKQQNVRTDLFGLGGICFDMITAGASPERFYDNIRVLDTEDQEVDTIKNSYDRLERGGATDAFNRNVFSIFRDLDTDSYAPSDVVVFILRCMLYKARGTFFAQE